MERRQHSGKLEGAWVLETQSLSRPNPELPPGSLGLWHNKLPFLLSYSFASFLFLEAKDTPPVTGRVTADHHHHPFYLVSKACNLQQTRTTFLPALWSVGYSPHLHVGMFRPRKSGHRLSGNELWSCVESHCRDPPPSHSASRRPGQFCDLMCLPSLHALNIHIPSSSSLHILISGVTSLD